MVKVTSSALAAMALAARTDHVYDLTSQLPQDFTGLDLQAELGDFTITKGGNQTSLIVETNSVLQYSVKGSAEKVVVQSTGVDWGSGLYTRTKFNIASNNPAIDFFSYTGGGGVGIGANVLTSSFLQLENHLSGVIKVPLLPDGFSKLHIVSDGSGSIYFEGLGNNPLSEFSAMQSGSGKISLVGVGAINNASVTISGSGAACLSGSGLSFQSLSASVVGSGQIGFKETNTSLPAAGSATAKVIGSGAISMCQVKLKTVSVNLEGSGVISTSSNDLSGSIVSSGNVKYVNLDPSTSPQVSVQGSGGVISSSTCPDDDVCRSITESPSAGWRCMPNLLLTAVGAQILWAISL